MGTELYNNASPHVWTHSLWSERAYARRRDDLVGETKFQTKILTPAKTGVGPYATSRDKIFFVHWPF